MVIVGQRMHDSFAEALDDVVVCVMTKADVGRLLLGDSRIAARISETLGRRIGELEQKFSDAVFKSVPERIAGALATLAAASSERPLGRGVQVKLTHEQLAALAATSRETTTKVLGELADQGHITLGRGRITVLDQERRASSAAESLEHHRRDIQTLRGSSVPHRGYGVRPSDQDVSAGPRL